jgi:hypothetical protein
VNHIATGRAHSPGGELLPPHHRKQQWRWRSMRSMETAETMMETDGDGSGGTSPSRKGAGIETYVPQNSSAAAVKLRNCSGKNVDSPRVFPSRGLYRRKGIVRGRAS